MPLLNEQRYSFADYDTWDESVRSEIIEGMIYDQATPSISHQRVSGEIFAQLHNFLTDKPCQVFAAPVSVCPFASRDSEESEISTVLEPDIIVVCDEDKIKEKGIWGAPDLVVEIISPSSMRRDSLTKFNLYMKAGVREYWLVDPKEKTAKSFVLEDGHYIASGFAAAGEIMPVAILKGCEIDFAKAF